MEIILPVETEKQIIKAEKLQWKLYNKYNSVKVYPFGLCKVKIVASN